MFLLVYILALTFLAVIVTTRVIARHKHRWETIPVSVALANKRFRSRSLSPIPRRVRLAIASTYAWGLFTGFLFVPGGITLLHFYSDDAFFSYVLSFACLSAIVLAFVYAIAARALAIGNRTFVHGAAVASLGQHLVVLFTFFAPVDIELFAVAAVPCGLGFMQAIQLLWASKALPKNTEFTDG